MTVSSETARWDYTGDGSTTEFSYNNLIFEDSDLDVYVDGSLQVLNTDYTVSGAGTVSGGDVTFTTAPSNNSEVVIIRDAANTQGSDYPVGGALSSSTLESDLDRRTVIAQDQQKLIDRSLKYPQIEQNAPSAELPSKSSRADKYLGFDAGGAPTALAGTSETPSAVRSADSIRALVDASQNGRVFVRAFYSDTDTGGGHFYWDADRDKSTANGGTIIDPDNVGTLSATALGTFASQQGTGVGTGCWVRIHNGQISLADFGIQADSDGTTGNGVDHNDALSNLGSFLSGNGGITVYGLDGIVRYVPTTDDKTLDLTSSEGITFHCGGTTFFDDKNYDQVADELTYFLHLTTCKYVNGEIGKVKSEAITSGEGGNRAIFCLDTCEHIDFDIETQGCGRAFEAKQARADAVSKRSRFLNVNARCVDTDQPVNFDFSGDHSRAVVNCEGAGRPFFINNGRDLEIRLRTKNQNSTAALVNWGSNIGGCENVTIIYEDTESTEYPSSLTLMDFTYDARDGGASANNIEIEFNTINTATNPYARALRFRKLDATGTDGDSANQSHSLNNLTLRGIVDNTNGGTDILADSSTSAFASGEVVRGLRLQNLQALGIGSSNINLPFFQGADIKDRLVYENGHCEGNFFFNGPAVFQSVHSRGSLGDNTAEHVYIHCNIEDAGGFQQLTNKTFVRTLLSGNLRGVTTGGTETQSGDGSTTTFSIAHGLDAAPNNVSVDPASTAAAEKFWISGIGATSINLTYAAAPASAADNLSWRWRAEL